MAGLRATKKVASGLRNRDRTTSEARGLKVVDSEKENVLRFHLLDFIRAWDMLLVSSLTLKSTPCPSSFTAMLNRPNG